MSPLISDRNLIAVFLTLTLSGCYYKFLFDILGIYCAVYV